LETTRINDLVERWKTLFPPSIVLTCVGSVKGYDLRQKIGYCQPHDKALEDWLILKYGTSDANISISYGDWPACKGGINLVKAP
jgi:hypothetical protein